jgi:hypothetical protein
MAAVSRNDLCPCGSGKKYKKCCLNAPDPKVARHSRNLKIGVAVLTIVTVLAFFLAGRGIGSAVGMASFGLAIGYMMMGPPPSADGKGSGGGMLGGSKPPTGKPPV